MAESVKHMALVASMTEWIGQSLFAGDYSSILIDAASSDIQHKPPYINGYVPDVFAEHSHSRELVIGEAKTSNDVENNHTKAQLIAFLRFCAIRNNSTLVLAVPWHLTRFTRQMVKMLALLNNATTVRVVVLDGL